MQNDSVSSTTANQNATFDQGSMNVSPNTFTVKADVIFHAACPDSLDPGSAIPKEKSLPAEARPSASDMQLVEEDQALHHPWPWDTNASVHRTLSAGDCLQYGGSSDSGFQDHIQPFSSSKAHEPEHEKDHVDSIGNNGVKDPCDVAQPKVPWSLETGFGPGLINASHFTEYAHGRPGFEVAQGRTESVVGIKEPPSVKKQNPDLVIEVGGQKIEAHKAVLAEKSDYFKARLSRDILKVKGMSYKTLSVLIDYVYTSKMNVNKDNIVDVVTGAKILQIPCAVQAAIDTMAQQITTANCYEILTIAKKQRLNELKDTAYRFMSDHFLQVLKDPAVYGRLTGSERDLILKMRMEGKKSLMVAEINDVFDRVGSRPPSRNNSRPQSPLSVASFEENHMIYHYSDTTKDWRSLTLMPEEINTKGCGICTMYNYLFVAGGIKAYGEKGKLSDKVFCYNPVTDKWSETRPLNQARSQLKLVSMDGYLYAIGGECLFTVEKYDPRLDRWTSVAPLPKGAFAVAHEATTCNGELYVSGGSLFYRLLKYDPKRDEWQECPYNNSRKKSTDMVALKSFIYRFDVNREQGVNVFKYNTIVKMWQDCAALQQTNPLPFRCAVVGNCIYCVNKAQTLQFVVGEEGAQFVEELLKAPLEAKGILFPFILTLPEQSDRNL
ncbi:kelch repeat and BTB domain-containing protein 11 [Denticeps clupeoides]|uniref:BTB domain-containing protein n=1 Tax=Denticeps clupeoides TaxID=299321 RepID=A0AAY4C245_9TELE|nr:kelch repeat and BTB domain-containing protein 11 [Denticeps clupeoides]XP_028837625.1 kelch repeat and BTB domain-containing protein 11 [Denticeps clupeoides]